MNSKNVYNIYINDINVYNVSKQNAIKLQYPTGNTIFYAIKNIYIYISSIIIQAKLPFPIYHKKIQKKNILQFAKKEMRIRFKWGEANNGGRKVKNWKVFFVQLKCFETNDRRASVTCARFMRWSEKHLKSIVLESRLRSSYTTPSVSTPIALRSFTLLLDSTDPWLQLSILVNWKIALGIYASHLAYAWPPHWEETKEGSLFEWRTTYVYDTG